MEMIGLISHINDRLNEWARWASSDARIGYPKSSPIYSAMRGGRCGDDDIITNAPAEEIERAVLLLPDGHKQIIAHVYIKRHSVMQAARSLLVSPATVKARINEAHLAIDMFLKTSRRG